MTDFSEDEQLKSLMKTQADYHVAPENLRAQIARMAKTKETTTDSSWFNWLQPQFRQMLSGMVFGVVVATLVTSLWMTNQQAKQSTFLALAADHAHAIVTENTIEVRSTDMHTVKPWLSSKLGYSPQIADLAEQGFPLMGGRRGFIGATPVAVAVYAYKKHEIDVYAMPVATFQHFSANSESINGFNTSAWSAGDIHYLAISDMNNKQLVAFSKLLEKKQSELE